MSRRIVIGMSGSTNEWVVAIQAVKVSCHGQSPVYVMSNVEWLMLTRSLRRAHLVVCSTRELIHKGDMQMSYDEKQVLATVERMTAAFQNGDFDNIMNAYENNAVIVFEPGRPVSDPAVVRATFK